MHDFSLAKSIVENVLSSAKEKKARKIQSIEISVGELLLLGEDEGFKFWLKEMLCKEGIAKDAQIKINIVKAKVKCKKCGYEGKLEPSKEHGHDHSHPIFLCPDCGQSSLDIREGRDCVIKRVKLEI